MTVSSMAERAASPWEQMVEDDERDLVHIKPTVHNVQPEHRRNAPVVTSNGIGYLDIEGDWVSNIEQIVRVYVDEKGDCYSELKSSRYNQKKNYCSIKAEDINGRQTLTCGPFKLHKAFCTDGQVTAIEWQGLKNVALWRTWTRSSNTWNKPIPADLPSSGAAAATNAPASGETWTAPVKNDWRSSSNKWNGYSDRAGGEPLKAGDWLCSYCFQAQYQTDNTCWNRRCGKRRHADALVINHHSAGGSHSKQRVPEEPDTTDTTEHNASESVPAEANAQPMASSALAWLDAFVPEALPQEHARGRADSSATSDSEKVTCGGALGNSLLDEALSQLEESTSILESAFTGTGESAPLEAYAHAAPEDTSYVLAWPTGFSDPSLEEPQIQAARWRYVPPPPPPPLLPVQEDVSASTESGAQTSSDVTPEVTVVVGPPPPPPPPPVKKVFPDDRTDDGASQVSTAPGSRASSKNSIHDSIPRSQDSGDPKFSPQSSPKSDSSKNPSVVDVGEGTMTFVIQEIDEVDEVEQELPQQRGLTQQQLNDLCTDEPELCDGGDGDFVGQFAVKVAHHADAADQANNTDDEFEENITLYAGAIYPLTVEEPVKFDDADGDETPKRLRRCASCPAILVAVEQTAEVREQKQNRFARKGKGVGAYRLVAERKANEEALLEAKRKEGEEARLQAERQAIEKALLEAKRKAAAEARFEAERAAKEEALLEAKRKEGEEARLQAERHAIGKALLEAKRKAAAEARFEAERVAKEDALLEAKRKEGEEARLEAERQAIEKERLEAKRKAAEEAQLEAEQKVIQEALLKAEYKAADDARFEAERKAKEEALLEAKGKEVDEARLDAERQATEEARLEAAPAEAATQEADEEPAQADVADGFGPRPGRPKLSRAQQRKRKKEAARAARAAL